MSEQGLNVFECIRQWAVDKKLDGPERVQPQMIKLMEEVGELAKGIVQQNKYDIDDALGDCVVVLTILAQSQGRKIEDCIEGAWSVIENRKGVSVNGFFVKQDCEAGLTGEDRACGGD